MCAKNNERAHKITGFTEKMEGTAAVAGNKEKEACTASFARKCQKCSFISPLIYLKRKLISSKALNYSSTSQVMYMLRSTYLL